MSNELQEMIAANERQREFYERPIEVRMGQGEDGSLATKAYTAVHTRLVRAYTSAEIQEDVVRLHQRWAGDPTGKKVLDLGVLDGTPMTWWLAKRCGNFVAIDLSAPSVARVQRALAHLPHARALVADFLSPEFEERDFDLVHAAAVLHHFRHLEQMLDVLHDRLAPGGRVITYDPLQTALPVRLARALYRPFQQDAEWEWPFTRAAVRAIERKFRIVELRGVLGAAKWGIPLAVLLPERGTRVLRRLHEHDMRTNMRVDRSLWRCMHVTMLLERR
jgi:SAM-dependent methyltransferase